MDMGLLRGIQTILVMIAFFGIIWWAYSAHRKKANDEASRLPFDDDEIADRTVQQDKTEKKQ
ncbi:CcoQ/FixQ family Cbb3-type cytochrome c oxidase assembly chaperone [uncultured Marinobacter sp.]|uniref:cbb3-type cytochrome oxidase subunit 3 n=1 Tax=uncultured Marinobacter sp. TaxID=187379 RepID=UPI0030D967DF|tara:strand:- start:203 stop:388 length:186 start_codon:yes stop_codon:yes gene_type:complete